MSRGIISKIQTMRKEADFEVMDKICVYVQDNDKIPDIMKAHEEEIRARFLQNSSSLVRQTDM